MIYIIKENRTYDQIFGDIKEGDGDPSLVMFGRKVTPNQHALAREFVLLDNFYCAGVLSADGHAWATEAYVTDYLERHFGGFIRSYPYDGDDPLAYASSGFLWDNALAHGKTFRDYGEFIKAKITPPKAHGRTFTRIIAKARRGSRLRPVPRSKPCAITSARRLSGFRAPFPMCTGRREFLKEFREFEAKGSLPNLIVMLLPNDHTSGTRPRLPTPRAVVADNDLALGQIVEAVTKSRFWPETAIFVAEDDPQAGLDHIDGHRTIAQVISPYTRREIRGPFLLFAGRHGQDDRVDPGIAADEPDGPGRAAHARLLPGTRRPHTVHRPPERSAPGRDESEAGRSLGPAPVLGSKIARTRPRRSRRGRRRDPQHDRLARHQRLRRPLPKKGTRIIFREKGTRVNFGRKGHIDHRP